MVCENGTVKLNMRDFAMGGMAMPAGNVEMDFTGDELVLPATLKAGETLPGASFGIIARMGRSKDHGSQLHRQGTKSRRYRNPRDTRREIDCYKVTYLTETQGMIGKARSFKQLPGTPRSGHGPQRILRRQRENDWLHRTYQL
jgi:hypothetical protein